MVAVATVEVFDRGKTALTERVAALNKRAAQHGMVPMTVTVDRIKAFIPVLVGGRFGAQQNMFVLTIEGVAPRIRGWSLIAKVSFTSVGTIVKPMADYDNLAEYRTIGPVCEHCNTCRNRKDVFVLENENGNRKIIGRNCLADFLRCDDAESFALYAEFADKIKDTVDNREWDREEYAGRWAKVSDLERFLTVVAMLTRKIGWTSRSESRDGGGLATADQAADYLFRSNHVDIKRWIENNDLTVSDDDAGKALAAIAWAKGVDDYNEYLHTIKTIAEAGFVEFPGLEGYAASIIVAYDRELSKRAKKTSKGKEKVYFGTKGKREKGIKVTCTGIHTCDGYYGTVTIIGFEHRTDNAVALLVWFASGSKEDDFDIGTDYTIDATIKDHIENDIYGKQTKINRVKVK